jgi:mannose-6-phosphate isomerase-like protein (cupin superfamily)
MSERFDKFTESARRVLQYAQEESQRFKHNYIGTEHLLLGLVREQDGVAAKVLTDQGVDLLSVRSAVEFIIGRGEEAPAGQVGLTPRAKRVIELSVDEARRLNHHYVGTEHLLLGLIREGEGIAAGVLNSLGVKLEAVRQSMTELLDENEAPDQGREPRLRSVLRPLERLRRRGLVGVRTTDPWPAFGTAPDVKQLDAILQDLDRLTEEIAYRRCASGPGYECGIARFLPRQATDARQITHADKDVVCHVLQGHGQLLAGGEINELAPGSLCRIPAGTPHDFTATREPLIVFYVSVAVG